MVVKQTGRTRKSFDLAFPQRALIQRSNRTITTSDVPELCAIPFQVDYKEKILITSFNYFFASSEPVDDTFIDIFFRMGENGAIGDTVASLALATENAFFVDTKQYEVSSTGWALVQRSNFVDVDPDMLVVGSDEVQTQLEVWLSHSSGGSSVNYGYTIYYIREIHQTIIPNDDAFADMLYEEILGNVCEE